MPDHLVAPRSPAPPLLQRARAPTGAELAVVPWLRLLTAAERTQIVAQLQVADAEVGDMVCRSAARHVSGSASSTACSR
jgi:CRP/FNR family cyclic AMP-dependent transcriptional regulator